MKEFLKDSSGPTATEYAVMLALIVLVCFGAIRGIGLGWQEKIFVQITNAIPS